MLDFVYVWYSSGALETNCKSTERKIVILLLAQTKCCHLLNGLLTKFRNNLWSEIDKKNFSDDDDGKIMCETFENKLIIVTSNFFIVVH